MVLAEIFSWWYIKGWSVFITKIKNWLQNITDFFSMSSLIRTLFKPYRQISAETASENASLDLKFHMFLDRLVSRVVGFFSRLILLAIGTVLIIIGSLICLLLIIIWPLIPLAPLAGIFLSLHGVTL